MSPTSTAATLPCPFVPSIRLFTERLLVEEPDALSPSYEEREIPVLRLSFDYGGTELSASDPRRQFFVAGRGALATVARDESSEDHARRVLESFGAVELACLEGYGTAPDSEADYLVQLDGNIHTWCSFTAYALPQLRALGWRVEMDPGYPYQVVTGDLPWYSHIHGEERPDWFGLELGVEIDGRRVNLLPALLDLIGESSGVSNLNALLRIPARFRAVQVDEHRYLALPPQRVSDLLEVLVELYHGERLDSGLLRFPAFHAASVTKLESVLAREGRPVRLGGAGHVRDRGQALSMAPEASCETVPIELAATLRPYQADGVAWLGRLRALGAGGVLADDMGLGKTLQTIAHLAAEKAAGRIEGPSLVVMPTSLVGNWRRELARFAPGLKVVALHGSKRRALFDSAFESDVVLTTYPLLLRDREIYEGQSFYYLVLDEAQVIKNRRSLIHRAIAGLTAQHRLCLTGTPVENNLDELWSIFQCAMPGLLGDADRFHTRMARAAEEGSEAEQCKALRGLVAPFILRRLKEDVARDLPSKTELVRPVELVGEQRDLYESIRMAAHAQVRRAIQKLGLSRSTIPILDALMKLRQACCDPRLLTVPAAAKVKRSAKYDLFFELLDKQLEQGRRVLVFSQFTQMLALLSQGLREREIRHVALTGSTAQRQKPIDEFSEGKSDVFLISLKAGGTGLNLTSADTVIHYDPWWNPAAQAQATDRAYRIGQTRPVFVYNLIVAGSVEERMLALQHRKKNLADAIIGPQRDGPSRLSEGELDGLFAPLIGGPPLA
jgi:superfamily II DNA or RNA helicase